MTDNWNGGKELVVCAAREWTVLIYVISLWLKCQEFTWDIIVIEVFVFMDDSAQGWESVLLNIDLISIQESKILLVFLAGLQELEIFVEVIPDVVKDIYAFTKYLKQSSGRIEAPLISCLIFGQVFSMHGSRVFFFSAQVVCFIAFTVNVALMRYSWHLIPIVDFLC